MGDQTEILRKTLAGVLASKWDTVWRASVWFCIGALNTFIASDLSSEHVAKLNRWQGLQLACSVFLAGLVAIKPFFDQSKNGR